MQTRRTLTYPREESKQEALDFKFKCMANPNSAMEQLKQENQAEETRKYLAHLFMEIRESEQRYYEENLKGKEEKDLSNDQKEIAKRSIDREKRKQASAEKERDDNDTGVLETIGKEAPFPLFSKKFQDINGVKVDVNLKGFSAYAQLKTINEILKQKKCLVL